jgi:hypothetical protein
MAFVTFADWLEDVIDEGSDAHPSEICAAFNAGKETRA